MSLATRNKPRPVCRTRTLFAGAIAYACLPGLRRDIRRHLARDVLRHVVRDAGLDVYGVWRGGVQAPPASDVRFSPVGIEDRVLRYWHRFRDRTDMARTRPSLTTHPLRHPLSSFLLSFFPPSSSMQAVTTRTTFQNNTCVIRSRTARAMGASRPTIRGVRRNSANGDVQGEMLEPSLANNPLVRVGSIVAITAVSAKAGGVLLSAKLLAFLHVMCFGMWFGTLAWTSTVFGVVAFRHLPRQMFGSLQSHLFPKYFAVTASMPLLLIGTLYALSGGVPPMHEVRLLAIAAFTAVAISPSRSPGRPRSCSSVMPWRKLLRLSVTRRGSPR